MNLKTKNSSRRVDMPLKPISLTKIANISIIGLVGKVFANGPGDPGQVIPKTLKMVLDTSLLNIQQYKVCIKGKVEQSRERSSTHPYTSV